MCHLHDGVRAPLTLAPAHLQANDKINDTQIMVDTNDTQIMVDTNDTQIVVNTNEGGGLLQLTTSPSSKRSRSETSSLCNALSSLEQKDLEGDLKKSELENIALMEELLNTQAQLESAVTKIGRDGLRIQALKERLGDDAQAALATCPETQEF